MLFRSGKLPTLKMPTAQGWSAGQTPVAAAGLKVNAFASGLKHPGEDWGQVLLVAIGKQHSLRAKPHSESRQTSGKT